MRFGKLPTRFHVATDEAAVTLTSGGAAGVCWPSIVTPSSTPAFALLTMTRKVPETAKPVFFPMAELCVNVETCEPTPRLSSPRCWSRREGICKPLFLLSPLNPSHMVWWRSRVLAATSTLLPAVTCAPVASTASDRLVTNPRFIATARTNPELLPLASVTLDVLRFSRTAANPWACDVRRSSVSERSTNAPPVLTLPETFAVDLLVCMPKVTAPTPRKDRSARSALLS